MKKFIIFALTFIIFAIVACQNNESKNKSDQIQKTDKNLIVPSENFNINLPFFWGFNLNNIISMSIISDSTHLHPLNIGRYAYFVLTKGFKNEDQKLLNIGKLYLDFLIKYPYLYNTDNSTIYLYAFTHNHFRKYEWWSAMANSTIALAFLKGYEIFKDENYRISFQKAMEGIIKTIEENGSALELDKEAKWYLEYCSKNTNNENAYFVLNGFLYTLLAIHIAYNKTNQKKYLKAYNSGEIAFQKLQKHFYYKDNSWTYYMLNPKTIEPVHYAIYNILLLKALYKSTGDQLYLKEIEKRRSILKSSYPLFKKIENDKDIYLFSTIGPPHPYWIDIYQIIINYYSGKQLIKQSKMLPPRTLTYDIIDRGFQIDTFKTNTINRIEVYASYGKDTILLYGIDNSNIQTINSEKTRTYKYTNKSLFDAKITNDSPLTLLNKAGKEKLNKGAIRMIFDQPVNIKEGRLFGLLINPEDRINSVMIILLDNNRKSAYRYYIKLNINEENFVLLSRIGFKNNQNLSANEIKEIRFIFYTNKPKHDQPFKIEIGKFYTFENNFKLYNFFKENDFFFPEKLIHGNIY